MHQFALRWPRFKQLGPKRDGAKVDRQVMQAAMEHLPAEFREILLLREFEDLSYKEIAMIAKIPVGTVMSRLARARGLLTKNLEQEFRAKVSK